MKNKKGDAGHFDDSTREKARATKREIADTINTRGRADARRQPGEVRAMRDAVMSFCTECITGYASDDGEGTQAEQVRRCQATSCHLWPWRRGTMDLDEMKGEHDG